MPESTLSITYATIRREIARFLGQTDSGIDTQMNDLIAEGLRRFYNPSPLPGRDRSHSWSFLQAGQTLTTIADQDVYVLPDNFGWLTSPNFVYADSSTASPIVVMAEHQLREIKSYGLTSTGKPAAAAIRSRSTDGVDGQRWEAVFSPIPDDDYPLSYRYRIQPQMISASYPYPLGGMQHGNAILEACLAAAEERINDTVGLHQRKFLEALAASIAMDANQGARTLGVDYGDQDERYGMIRRHSDTPTVTNSF